VILIIPSCSVLFLFLFFVLFAVLLCFCLGAELSTSFHATVSIKGFIGNFLIVNASFAGHNYGSSSMATRCSRDSYDDSVNNCTQVTALKVQKCFAMSCCISCLGSTIESSIIHLL
jgi:hypothetical protein